MNKIDNNFTVDNCNCKSISQIRVQHKSFLPSLIYTMLFVFYPAHTLCLNPMFLLKQLQHIILDKDLTYKNTQNTHKYQRGIKKEAKMLSSHLRFSFSSKNFYNIFESRRTLTFHSDQAQCFRSYAS